MNQKATALTFLVILIVATFCTLQPSSAQQTTLANTINTVTNKIQNWNSPWTVLYGQIFGSTNSSAFDTAIQQSFAQNDSLNVFLIARSAELNGYSSSTINSTLIATLKQGVPYFTMYDRYMPYIYQLAQQLGVSGWNISSLNIPYPALYLTGGGVGRYYDEYAESLSMLLQLDKLGIDTTSQMADDWQQTQTLWNPPITTDSGTVLTQGYYQYATGDTDIECEMGNFAQVITEYQNQVGTVPYFNNVITDLVTKLLSNNFGSPAWGTTGVIQHANPSNPQLRLGETLGVMIALQMLYPDFSSDMQGNFQNMQPNMWQGLTSSGLYSNGRFSTNTLYGDTSPSDDASSMGAMTLFLDGIIPQTGYLAINASNEAYQDYRTCFPTSEWKFNYQNQSIRIPVIAGNLGFVFGSQQVTQNFPTNGVYNIQFSSDWNNIISLTKIDNVTNFISQPVLVPAPIVTPIPTPIPTLIPSQTLSPLVTPKATISPTPSPTSSATQAVPSPTPAVPEFPTIAVTAIFFALSLFAVTMLTVRKCKTSKFSSVPFK